MTKAHYKPFVCISVARGDFAGRGFDASKLTDKEMEDIGDQIGEAMMEAGVFWDMVDDIAKDRELPPAPAIDACETCKTPMTEADYMCPNDDCPDNRAKK